MYKLSTAKQLSSLQMSELIDFPPHLETLLNSAYSQSSFVVFVFSITISNSFDGYAVMKGPANQRGRHVDGRNATSCAVEVVRRANVPFADVSYIRDDIGLHGRPITTANSGSVLGPVAGRALCRLIDKRAYRDDPFHYKDTKQVKRVLNVDQNMLSSTIIPSLHETSFLSINYSAYCEWYDNHEPSESVPSLHSLMFT